MCFKWFSNYKNCICKNAIHAVRMNSNALQILLIMEMPSILTTDQQNTKLSVYLKTKHVMEFLTVPTDLTRMQIFVQVLWHVKMLHCGYIMCCLFMGSLYLLLYRETWIIFTNRQRDMSCEERVAILFIDNKNM